MTALSTARARALVALCALALSLPNSSCTLLWLFNNDPAGLPCDFDTSTDGACLDGYVCVEQAPNEFVCVVQGNLQKGEPCVDSGQCDEGLVCQTAYASCKENGDDPNCSLIPNAEKDLACREVCDIGNPTTCADNEACIDSEPDFCQRAVCATDTDCETVAGQGALCSGEALNEGTSGLCFEACDPLTCDNGVCPDCTGVDGAIDADKTCVPVFDEALSNRTICDFTGPLENFQDCSNGERCVAGSFCAFFAQDKVVCTPWCRFGSLADPQCPASANCTQVVADLGICIQP